MRKNRKRVHVREHIRNYGNSTSRVRSHFRVLRQTPRQRHERLVIARKEGAEAEQIAILMFQSSGFKTTNLSSATKGAGDILVTDAVGNTWLVEVKKINEWEQTSLHSRRRGRIQINRTEHYAMLRNAKGLNAKPLYLIFVQHDSGITTKRFVSAKTITDYVKDKEYHEIKIPYSLVVSEEFDIAKFKR